jgi:hypothetical protein
MTWEQGIYAFAIHIYCHIYEDFSHAYVFKRQTISAIEVMASMTDFDCCERNIM